MIYLMKPVEEEKQDKTKNSWVPLIDMFMEMDEPIMEVRGWQDTCESSYVAWRSLRIAINRGQYKAKCFVKHHRLYIEKES